MAIIQYPGTNFHDLNLDWVLEQVKNLLTEWGETRTDWENLLADNTEFKSTIENEWDSFREYIVTHIDETVPAEVAAEINRMASDGRLLAIITADPTGEGSVLTDAVSEWLTNNLTPTEPPVDPNLVISGAAADAKVTGDEVAILKAAVTALGNLSNVEVVEVTNILGTDGNFEDFTLSAQHWYKSSNDSTASVTDNVLSFDAGVQFASIRHFFSVTAQHKYYFFGTLKTETGSAYMSISINEPLISIPSDNVWNYRAGIYTPASSGTATFCISDSSQSPQVIYAKKCGVIDLTDTFGAGNEPDIDTMNAAMHIVNDFIIEGFLYFVQEVPVEPKNYENKKILFMGDSITAANLNNNGWCKYFNAILNPAKTVNVAVSGATWSDNEGTVYDGNPSYSDQTNNTIGNQVEKIARGKNTSNPNYSHVADYDDFDIIIISAGTNDTNTNFDTDYIKNALVGAGNVPLAYTDIDTKNAIGAMAYAYERLYTMYPNARYYYCTPIQAYPVKKGWGEIQNKGSVMKAMGDYIPPIIIDSEKCGIFGNQEQNNAEGVNLSDGLHPNAHGAELLGKYNANAVIKTYLGE